MRPLLPSSALLLLVLLQDGHKLRIRRGYIKVEPTSKLARDFASLPFSLASLVELIMYSDSTCRFCHASFQVLFGHIFCKRDIRSVMCEREHERVFIFVCVFVCERAFVCVVCVSLCMFVWCVFGCVLVRLRE